MNKQLVFCYIITNKQYRNLKLLKSKLIKYSFSKTVKMGIRAYKWNWTEQQGTMNQDHNLVSPIGF